MWGDDSEFCFDTFDLGPYHRKANTSSATNQFRAATVQRLFANVITSAGSHFSLVIGAKHKTMRIVHRAPSLLAKVTTALTSISRAFAKRHISEDLKNTIVFESESTATAKNQNSNSQALWVCIHPSTELPK